ncbi:hypothetical protein ACQ4LE_004155, partial [Meloidogyne hapla]
MLKEKRQLQEKINKKTAGEDKIQSQMILEKLNVKEKANLLMKGKSKEKVLLSSKASIQEKSEVSSNFVNKEEWGSTRKIQKSASEINISFKLKEFGEDNTTLFLSFVKSLEDLQKTEINLKDKFKIIEELNTKFAEETKIKFEQLLHRSKSEIEVSKLLRDQQEDKIIMKSKESAQEMKDFQATLSGKEERENANKIIKSASQSLIKFKAREFNEERTSSIISIEQKSKNWEEFEIKLEEKRQLHEKIDAKTAGDYKIQSQMIFEQLNAQEKAYLNLKEKLQEKALLSSKASIHEKKEFSSNLIGKEEWEDTKLLQKSASLSSIKFTTKEFGEEKTNSVISIEQKSKDREEIEIKFDEKRQLKDKLKTKSVSEDKIQGQMIFEKPTGEEKSSLFLKEKIKEKTLLSIEEKKDFSLNLLNKEVLQSTEKLQKSASLSSIKFKTKESIEERSTSLISLEHPKQY